VVTQHHIPDEDLELYSLNWLPTDKVAVVELHLLVCEWCRGRLQIEDEFTGAMKQGLRETSPAPRRG
jgi:hypothetical protein